MPPEAAEKTKVVFFRSVLYQVKLRWEYLLARVGEEFPLTCPRCGGDIRLISFITDPGLIWKILMHLGEPLEPPRSM
jgi:hypothetical protein